MYEETWKGIYVEYSRVNKEETVLSAEPAIEIVVIHRGQATSASFLQKMRGKFTIKEGIGYAVVGFSDRYTYDIVNQKYFEPMMQSFRFEAPRKTPPELTAEEHFYKGVEYHGKGMLDEAILECKKAIDINPNYAMAHYNLGAAYVDKGMLDEAILEWKKAIDIDPNYAEAHSNLGNAYRMKGMLEEAILECKKAIDINPNLAVAHNNLGAAYHMKGMFDEAILEGKKAIDINPNLAEAHCGLGAAYCEKGMFDEAILECKKAIDINPNLAEAHNNLAVAYYYKGQYDLAIKHCNRAIELGYKVDPKFLKVLEQQEIEWETYHNYEYGWSINYPSDWEVNKSEPDKIGFIGPDGIIIGVSSDGFSFPISVERFFTIFEEGVNEKLTIRGLRFLKVSKQRVEIDGELAIEAIFILAGESPDNPLGKHRIAATVKDRVGYMINCFCPPYFYDQANEVYFEPMIQSFKFIPRKTFIELILEAGGYSKQDLEDMPSITFRVSEDFYSAEE
jgi:Flp pilus assembly protein TadD